MLGYSEHPGRNPAGETVVLVKRDEPFSAQKLSEFHLPSIFLFNIYLSNVYTQKLV